MQGLHQIRESIRSRVEETTSRRPEWPCRKGCDDCCRRLASVPLVVEEEWREIVRALEGLPGEIAVEAVRRIRESAAASRPVTCPLLDTASGACLVYAARPIACRAYGFYAEREGVLGCHRIETIAREASDVVWGNHEAVEARVSELGIARPLFDWMENTAGQEACATLVSSKLPLRNEETPRTEPQRNRYPHSARRQ